MKRKYHYIILCVLSLIILLIAFNTIISKNKNKQLVEDLNNEKINAEEIIFKENGVYL